MKKIILISDPRVLEIPIDEIGDPLVDLHNYPEIIIDNRKSKDSDSYFRVRKIIVEKLIEISNNLGNGLRPLVIEGYRPLSLQSKYFTGHSKNLELAHPDWDKEKIYNEASKFVAPPDIIPPHSTGGAVDVTLVKDDGTELDMGTRININPEESDNACFTFASNIAESAKKNRQILIDSMSKSGFVNYPTEWWHWSYGDRYWAFVNKEKRALFGVL